MSTHLINNVKDLREAVKELTSHDRLSHDTETKGPDNVKDISGLYPFHGSRSFSHIFATREDEYYFDFNEGGIETKYKKELQPIFDDEKRIIFYVNAIFDACISHFDELKFNQRIVDCPSIARVEYNKHGKNPWDKVSFLSMEYLANYYGVKQKNDKVKEYIKEHQLYSEERCRFTGKVIPLYNKVPLDLMFEYGCDDARTTFDLGTKIITCINYKDKNYQSHREGIPAMIEVAKNEIEFTSVLVDMKIEGMRLWEDYTEKAIKAESKISDKLHKEIDELTGGINLNSGKQIASYLMEKGIEVPKKQPTPHAIVMADKWLEKAEIAKKAGKEKQFNQAIEKAKNYQAGNPITDKKTLNKLMEKHPELDFLSKISQAKEADKKIGTYYKNFMLLKDSNSYIHCDLNQETTKTGRLSSSNPNLQNLEKVYTSLDSDEYAVRKSFIADEGCRLFFFDYDQQEMILMLDQAEEMGVIEKLVKKIYTDFYLATAAQIKEMLNLVIERKQAKDTSLALAYGKGNLALAKSFGYVLPNATEEEEKEGIKRVKEFKNNFFKALPKLKRLMKRLESQVKFHGKIHNPFGRVLYFSTDESYKALNGFVQGGAADITKKAMVLIKKRFDEIRKEREIKSRLALCVHDELVFNIGIGEESLLIPIIKECMVNAYPKKHIGLTVGVDYSPINKYGFSSWGEKIEWTEN